MRTGRRRSSRAVRDRTARTGAARGSGHGDLQDAGPPLLALQQAVGNRAAAALVDRGRTVAPIQRDVTTTWNQVHEKKVPGAPGSKIYDTIREELKAYDLARKRDEELGPHLARLEELCTKYLALHAKSPADRGDVVVVHTVLNEVEADLGKGQTAAPEVVPAKAMDELGASPTELLPRLNWMLEMADASDATPEMKGAVADIREAKSQLALIRARQAASLRKQQGGGDDRRLRWPAADAGALSELLRGLFATFRTAALGFDDGAAMRAFGTQVKNLVADLEIGGKKGFDDVEVILSGSAVTGRALIAKKGAREPRPFGRHSDFDVAVVSKTLFAACKQADALLSDDGERTRPDPLPAIRAVSRVLEAQAGREVSIMVFRTRAAAQRSPGIRISS